MKGATTNIKQLELGARVQGDGSVRFTVWAPKAERLTVRVVTGGRWDDIALEQKADGYFEGATDKIRSGDLYWYVVNGKPWPDPVSRSQPQGVHGPSQVVDPRAFQWTDGAWKGLPLQDYIIYELHVGTFTPEGTFEAVISRLDHLVELGVTAIEVMPVSQFPGERNWGYDGVYPFAPQSSYGGPDGLRKLVDACHHKGLAVIMDVVYNHLGPEGNYLWQYGPYFTSHYRTPWGDAVNFDGPHSDDVRRYFIENALCWIDEYHVDALRLDAVHGIYDFSARPFLAELAETVHYHAVALGRQVHLMAESNLNDRRLTKPRQDEGYGLDVQWNDDFHHALHALLTGERLGYFEDFGEFGQMVTAVRDGFVYSGQYSSYRKRRHGSSSVDLPVEQLLVFSQNHDQIGNRMMGDRHSSRLPLEKLKLAAAAVLLSPYIPLLFMGEEYGETAPFQYFVSHSDKELIEAVRNGRREEFASFSWQGEVPDPPAESTFMNSKLDIDLRNNGNHRLLFGFYKELIRLRKTEPALLRPARERMQVAEFDEAQVICVRRWNQEDETIALYNFDEQPRTTVAPFPAGTWRKLLDSAEDKWGGSGGEAAKAVDSDGEGDAVALAPNSVVMYRRGKGI